MEADPDQARLVMETDPSTIKQPALKPAVAHRRGCSLTEGNQREGNHHG